jgi:hypothetical protein
VGLLERGQPDLGAEMSYLAVVTFDLDGASPRYYPRVQKQLGNMNLEKKLKIKRSRKFSSLPSNTFAGTFSGEWNEASASEVRDHLRAEVAKAIKTLGLKGTVFVAIGDSWSWGKKRSNNVSGQRWVGQELCPIRQEK